MKVLNDFRCPLGHTNEHFVDNSDTVAICYTCGCTATKVRSVPNFQLPGNDPAGFPSAHRNWERKRTQKIAQETKADNA